MVILAETLLGKGYALRIYDQNVLLARLTGANKDYIEQQIPHLSKLLCDSIDEVLDESDVVVIGNTAPEFGDAITRCRRGPDGPRSGSRSLRPGEGLSRVPRDLLVVGRAARDG